MNRVEDAGYFSKWCAGRMGRCTKLPPQLGQVLSKCASAQLAQNVHSNVQMRTSVALGGRSLSQHSQLGFRASMARLLFDLMLD